MAINSNELDLWEDVLGEILQTPPVEVKEVKHKLSKKEKVKTPAQLLKSKSTSVEDKLEIIKENVLNTLGTYAENTMLITSRDELHSYFDASIKSGILAVDTETNNSLDPITCKIMGLCLYTPGMKNAYAPVNHVDLKSGEKLYWQITEEDIREEFERVLTKVKFIFHNAKFDYQVIKCTCGIALPIYWDTMICARILDENEKASLKEQYIHKIDPSIQKYDIEKLFKGVQYAVVDPHIFALYAATDSFMTHRLYEWQIKQMNLPENKSLWKVLLEIEFPIITITAEMELTGVYVDSEYAELLSKYYHKISDELAKEAEQELLNLSDKINAWKNSPNAQTPIRDYVTEEEYKKDVDDGNADMYLYDGTKKAYYTEGKCKADKLTNPIKLTSPSQLSILFYDILGVPTGFAQKQAKGEHKELRGTGEDVLKAIRDEYNFKICDIILRMRECDKLIGTYIDKIPTCVCEKDGRVHTHFNQIGADTGRFSSSDPINLQNIPSHNHLIRSLFRSKPGYTLVGSDYSAQEPRMLATYSKDPNMSKAYKEGKDLYAVVASMAFHNNYEDNLEHYPDGTLYPDGKKRRSSAKSILLGLMYGRSAPAIAEQIKSTKEEAQGIIDSFYDGFPAVKKWIDDTYAFVRKYGYVEDLWGRRRRLNDIFLKPYEVYESNSKDNSNFNPLLGTKGLVQKKKNPLVEKYESELLKARNNSQKEKIKSEARKNGITIIDNGAYIAQAERQCVNARIQGGSASLTKLAMIKIANDPVLKSYDAHLIIGVHDELLIECKEEFAQEAGERLAYDMITAASDNGVDIPMKCDAEVFTWWYQDQIIGDIKKDIELIQADSSDFNFEQSYYRIIKDKYGCLTNSQIESFKKELYQSFI